MRGVADAPTRPRDRGRAVDRSAEGRGTADEDEIGWDMGGGWGAKNDLACARGPRAEAMAASASALISQGGEIGYTWAAGYDEPLMATCTGGGRVHKFSTLGSLRALQVRGRYEGRGR